MRDVTHVTAEQVAEAMASFDEMMGDDPMWSEMKHAGANPGEFTMTASPRPATDLDDGGSE